VTILKKQPRQELAGYESAAVAGGYTWTISSPSTSISKRSSGGCTDANMARVSSVIYNRLGVGQKLR
jgi:hypothetical protein